jgi:hypothetical protein
MSIISFFKEAGEKLFGKKAQAAQSEAADPAAIEAANREAATAIENYIKSMGLTATGLTVTYDGAKATAKVFRYRQGPGHQGENNTGHRKRARYRGR